MIETTAPGQFPDGMKKSSKAKLAYYLATTVGEGNVFKMGQVRAALPNINQIDRRMRELKEVKWKIPSYRDRDDLAPDEYRLDQIGDRVWEPDYVGPKTPAITATMRRKVFERDDNRCRECGIGAGEAYPDMPDRVARMTIGHWVPKERGGSNDFDNLRTECSMCNEPAKNLTETPVDPNLVKAKVKKLSRRDRQRLMAWVLAGRRTFDDVEEVWAEYRRIPGPAQDDVRGLLAELIA